MILILLNLRISYYDCVLNNKDLTLKMILTIVVVVVVVVIVFKKYWKQIVTLSSILLLPFVLGGTFFKRIKSRRAASESIPRGKLENNVKKMRKKYTV